MGRSAATGINSEIMSLLSNGGNPPAEDVDEKLVNPELVKSIGSLIVDGATVDQIAKALDAPTSHISATLRRERRRIAMLCFHGIGKHMVEFLGRHYKLMDRVLTEIETRDLGAMPTRDLVKLIDVTMRWINPIQKSMLLDAVDDRTAKPLDQQPQTITLGIINQLVTEAHTAQANAQEVLGKVSDCKLPHKRYPDSPIEAWADDISDLPRPAENELENEPYESDAGEKRGENDAATDQELS